MAEIVTVARPYAEAAFKLAKEQNQLDAWSDALRLLVTVVEHEEVARVIDNPNVSAPQIESLLQGIVGEQVSVEVKNFINTIADYDRLTLLPEIAFQFHALKNAHEGAADAEVISAFEMTAEQVNELAATLEKKFGRKLHPTVTVDSSLIGGVRVVVGDQVLDTSVRAKLQKMQAALTA